MFVSSLTVIALSNIFYVYIRYRENKREVLWKIELELMRKRAYKAAVIFKSIQ